jgi:alpha-galactosidase/6-phospho-beta-glucosidase family protein
MSKKIFTLIGAGSTVFTPGLLHDLAQSKLSDDFEVHLFDINHESSEIMAQVGNRIAQLHGSAMVVKAFSDRREALKNTDFVTTTIAVGAAEGWKADLEIPRKYGIHQTVGDSVGPGGVLRALRHVPALVSIAEDIADVAPNAWYINYSNPLTANVRGIHKYTGVNVVGLCHGTMYTRSKLLKDLHIEDVNVETIFAGINHLCWLIDIKRGSEDLYPILRKAVELHAGDVHAPINYEEGVHSPVSADLFKVFGLYPAPGDRHVAEFFGSYLTRQDSGELHWGLQGGLNMTELYIGEKGDLWDELRGQADGSIPVHKRDNQEAERLVSIAEALITGKSHVELAVNVPNNGAISNLPPEAVVEVPAVIGANGVTPLRVGALPKAIATVLTQRAQQQELTVTAAREESRSKAIQALYLDPLVASFEKATGILDDTIAFDPRHLGGFKQ